MPPDPTPNIRTLEHTADVGIEVEGPSLAVVMEGAVRGMTGLMLGEDRPSSYETRTLELQGDDSSLLLRALLRELLYLHEAEGFAVARSEVELLPTSDGSQRARVRVWGGKDPVRPLTELKGVTLHGLLAAPTAGGGWHARVIFDV